MAGCQPKGIQNCCNQLANPHPIPATETGMIDTDARAQTVRAFVATYGPN
jgi:hypothetical protein